MITIRKAHDRGHADHGWLNSYHTFSFASYYDPDHMGFRSLRVMNEDRVAPGQGFGTHAHENMEIISYVLAGALEHKDSMGNGAILQPGEFQRISAGTGIEHSEFNPSVEKPVHFYQIWLIPSQTDLSPSYEQKQFPDHQLNNQFCLVASPTGEKSSLTIHADARVYLSKLTAGEILTMPLAEERHNWIQVLRGAIELNGIVLDTSDAAALSEEPTLAITAISNAEIMIFDLV
ncbi:pirin family protein [Gimesia aquarii]|uniref:Quercetin 2,3-dioxygenase n=1 Tax=Gimesia aquarii TaxID=2527964 RepID=A0A517VSC5_9PLAN|nr:pirin family protein [Gimesia aquarii]QDT95915.1 Quercetin 2,3-dioxygenase [Gimesia aquarii]